MMQRMIGAWVLAAVLFAGAARAGDYAENWSKGLSFLAGQQQENGAFGSKKGALAGYTALVLQAWNAAPAGVKSANASFAARAAKAADWLAGQQDAAEGYLSDGSEYHNYSTALAVQALAGFDKEKYASVIAKGAAYLKGIQATEARKFDQKKHVTFGGFGYGSTLRQDLSNTWFALSALKAAGVAADDPVWANAVIFIKRCQNSSEVNDQPFAGDDGGAMYLPNDSPAGKAKSRDGKEVNKSFGSMTAALLSAYYLCGEKDDAKGVQLAQKWLADNFSVKENPSHNKQGQQALYYYYRALATALAQTGKAEFAGHKWKDELGAHVAELQKADGSWVNAESRFNENDPVLCTAYALNALGACGQ